MVSAVLNLLIVMMLAFFAWAGFRKGLILSAASLVIFFISIMVGVSVAAQNTESVAVKFDDLLSWVADDATEKAMAGLNGIDREKVTSAQAKSISEKAFTQMGIQKSAAEYLSGIVSKRFTANGDETLYEVVSAVFLRALAWVALFFAGFLVTNLLLSLIVNFIAALFNMPVLKWLDTIGGTVLGLFTGIFIMCAVGLGLRYLGMLLPDGLVDNTLLLKLFVYANPFGGVMAIK
ncbi:hypothetical protein FACS1894217_07750 [Clostridia bacterium]|nr:hypothetical protein FACS1894217_07750 [Clostridia bacterium]